MPQIITLCGIQPEQTDIDLHNCGLDAADAKLLAFDLSKNRTVRTLKYSAAPKYLLSCQHPLTLPLSPFCSLARNWLCGLNDDGDGEYTTEGFTKLCEGLKGSAVTSLECAAAPSVCVSVSAH